MIVQFRTPTAIPLEAFSLLGVNVKTTTTAIGRFGTGLKYAVAVILRHGGIIKLFVEGVEYEFYLHSKEFRGKTFQQIRMRKRDSGPIGRWLSSKALPFTTEFGKDWKLWQAYRELESNTIDEGGETLTFVYDGTNGGKSFRYDPPAKGTTIIVDCPGFYEVTQSSGVFLRDQDHGLMVYSDDSVTIYDAPSKYLYYQGIRVYDLRYPARLTYDFKQGYVNLTEDRTAGNAWYLLHMLGLILQQKMDSRNVLYKVLSKSRDENRYTPTFETMELNFDHTEPGSAAFAVAAEKLNQSGTGGKSISGYYGSYGAYVQRKDEMSVTLPRKDWDLVSEALSASLIDLILPDEVVAAVSRLQDKIGPDRMLF